MTIRPHILRSKSRVPKWLAASPLLLSLLFGAGLVISAPALSGCGATQSDTRVKYAVTARQNHEKGEAKLKSKAWVAAAKYFAFVKARFPYSKYAVLAEMGMADAEFGAGHYLQAIDGYKLFIKFHPTHDMTINGYASYRIGESYYKMLPGDWWLLPPSHEKDQSATADAHRQLESFLAKYPKSPYQEKAQKRLTKINQRLASHEMYVAKFYWERNKPMGTVLRLRRLLKQHAGTSYDAQAMFLLGQAYVKVKMPERAREVWAELVKTFPTHEKAQAAQSALAKLPG